MDINDVEVGKQYKFEHQSGEENYTMTVTSIEDDVVARLMFGEAMVRGTNEHGDYGLAMAKELSEL